MTHCGLLGPELGTGLDAAKAWSLATVQLCCAHKENMIRSTWCLLETSESNPVLTHRERSAHLTGVYAKG